MKLVLRKGSRCVAGQAEQHGGRRMSLFEQVDRLEREINRAKDKLNRLHLSIVARQQKLNRLLDRIYRNAAADLLGHDLK